VHGEIGGGGVLERARGPAVAAGRHSAGRAQARSVIDSAPMEPDDEVVSRRW
jgi:hypothetical protein